MNNEPSGPGPSCQACLPEHCSPCCVAIPCRRDIRAMAVHLSRSCPSVERIAAGLCRTMNGLFWVRRGSLAALRGAGPEGSLACAVAGRRVCSGTERRHQRERRRGQSLQ